MPLHVWPFENRMVRICEFIELATGVCCSIQLMLHALQRNHVFSLNLRIYMTMTYFGPMTKPFPIKMRKEYTISIRIVARIQHRNIEQQKKRNHRIALMLFGLILLRALLACTRARVCVCGVFCLSFD